MKRQYTSGIVYIWWKLISKTLTYSYKGYLAKAKDANGMECEYNFFKRDLLHRQYTQGVQG